MPKISVIIPCFNHGKFIKQAIESVKKQTFTDYEIIVINDGSTDKYTIEILDKLKFDYEDIIFIDQKNGHLSNARNNGIRISKGDFFLPLDADDIIEPNMLEDCYNKIKKRKNLGFVYTYARLFGDSNEVMVKKWYNFFDLLNLNYIVACSLFRKSCWNEVGGYDENMKSGYEDWEFLIRLGKNGFYGELIRKPLFCYRKHGYSMVNEAVGDHNKNFLYIKKKHIDLYKKSNLKKIKRHWLLGDFLKFLRYPFFLKDLIFFKLEAAGVFNVNIWINNPIEAMARIIPIKLKKRINNFFGKELFDISYFGKS